MPNVTFTLPNLFTLIRFLLSTLMFFLMLKHETFLSLMLLIIVGLTDLIDGYLARALNQKSSLGEMLDPMADKFMVLLALIALIRVYHFPIYGLLIISRDIISVMGSILIFVKKSANWKPNQLGKLTTFLQVLTLISYLTNFPYKNIILIITIISSILAAGIYFVRGLKIISTSYAPSQKQREQSSQ